MIRTCNHEKRKRSTSGRNCESWNRMTQWVVQPSPPQMPLTKVICKVKVINFQAFCDVNVLSFDTGTAQNVKPTSQYLKPTQEKPAEKANLFDEDHVRLLKFHNKLILQELLFFSCSRSNSRCCHVLLSSTASIRASVRSRTPHVTSTCAIWTRLTNHLTGMV